MIHYQNMGNSEGGVIYGHEIDFQLHIILYRHLIQYILDKMGTHFQANCKQFCTNSHFIESPFYREKIARLFNFFRFPFPEKQAFWPRNPCCFTSFLSQFPHFREILAIRRLNSHFIEFPFYREKIAAYFGENAIHFPILSNSHLIANVL